MDALSIEELHVLIRHYGAALMTNEKSAARVVEIAQALQKKHAEERARYSEDVI